MTSEALKEVTIYTDGACSGNPGPGGYGVVLISGKHRKELSGGFRLTTNNRMEMMGAKSPSGMASLTAGLEALKFQCAATVYSDSKYLVDAVTKGWAQRWRANGWKRNKKDLAMNPDLWGRLLDLCDRHPVNFLWVKGHAGIAENERCDELAVAASQEEDLAVDIGYEQ